MAIEVVSLGRHFTLQRNKLWGYTTIVAEHPGETSQYWKCISIKDLS